NSPEAASAHNRERRGRKIVVTNNATSNDTNPNVPHSKPKYVGRSSERHERHKWTWQCGRGRRNRQYWRNWKRGGHRWSWRSQWNRTCWRLARRRTWWTTSSGIIGGLPVGRH